MQVDNQKIAQTANQYCNSCCSTQPQSVISQPQPNSGNAQKYDYQYYQYPQGNIYPQAQVSQSYTTQPSGASAVNIQIYNPAVTAAGAQGPTCNVNAPNYYPHGSGCCCEKCQGTNNEAAATDSNTKTTEEKESSASSTTTTNTDKKTKKKTVVQLTDEYIKNLENYLNSQDKDVRLNAEQIKLIALTALESRIVTGDDYTKNVLEKMQTTDGAFGQDAIDASKILLQMSGKQIEKEVPVTQTTKTETKTETQKTESRKE